MVSIGFITIHLPPQIANISHPLEGLFYLIILAFVFRWRWPKTWNGYLKRISAPIVKERSKINSSQKD